jgi:hypothetical protein
MKKLYTSILIIILLTFSQSGVIGQGGMWLPHLLEGMNETEMQDLGMELSAQDIYDINASSIKDAIVQFGGGCTAEIISSKGLLLTNHHCGYGRIQAHSSVENNLLKNAPHTADCIINKNWNYPYSPQEAAYPVSYLKDFKYWVPVRRVDNAYGDRNLVCACPSIESYMMS